MSAANTHTRLIGVLLLAVTLCVGESWSEDRLTLRDEVYVKGPMLRLGDVADIEGVNADVLSQIEVSAAALPGATKNLNASLVASRLRGAGVDTDSVEIEGAVQTRATTLHIDISPTMIAHSLRDYILTTMPWDPEDTFIDVPPPRSEIIAPDGVISIAWTPAPQYRFLGAGSFRGAISVDGEVQKTLLLKATVDPQGTVLVARRDIARGLMIGVNDIELRTVSLSQAPSDVLINPDEALNKVAKRTIFSGQPLLPNYLDLPILVRRNQEVPVEVSHSSMHIQIRARALTDARAGDTVACANLGSKDQFYGVLRSDGVIVVP